jgi:glucose/arabinose dehydrogenase
MALIRRRTAIWLVLLAFVGGLGSPSAASAAFDPNKIKIGLQQVGTGFSSSILATSARDGSGRLFVVQQSGYVRTLASGPGGPTFLDVGTRVLYDGERGLLGLAFHPSFKTNGKLYVNYTRVGDGATVIDEYRITTDANNVNEIATRREILVISQPYPNHNGGGIAFGPDGFLYIGMGDGGDGGDPQDRAQDINSLLGKMLRIDVNGTSTGLQYRIPATNPYVGVAGRDEIWSTGLRNPWRWSFDRLTGDLWIADVGQESWEEVNRATAASGGARGLNFGWDDMEGRHCYEPTSGCLTAGRTLPIAEYAHVVTGEDNCSITGGYVYRGNQFLLLRGGYLYADFCSGRIWTISATAASPATGREVLDTSLNIVSFGEDEWGELYVVAQNGSIHHVRELSRRPIVVGR